MDKQTASVVLNGAVADLRGRSYPQLCALIGDPRCEEIAGPDGNAYQIEFEAYWDDPRKKSGNVRVLISVDDGTFRASFDPMTRSFIKAPDGTFVGESENQD